jgi:hypothetical protein
MTLVETLKLREYRTRKSLCDFLRYTDDDVNILIFEGAYEYLEKIFGTDAYGMKHLPQTAQFWSWWRKEWAKIDSMFVDNVEDQGDGWTVRARDNDLCFQFCRDLEDLRAEYLYYHEISMNNRYINSEVVRAGAHEIMSAVINEAKKEVSGNQLSVIGKEVRNG